MRRSSLLVNLWSLLFFLSFHWPLTSSLAHCAFAPRPDTSCDPAQTRSPESPNATKDKPQARLLILAPPGTFRPPQLSLLDLARLVAAVVRRLISLLLQALATAVSAFYVPPVKRIYSILRKGKKLTLALFSRTSFPQVFSLSVMDELPCQQWTSCWLLWICDFRSISTEGSLLL